MGYLKTHFNINGYQGTLPKKLGAVKLLLIERPNKLDKSIVNDFTFAKVYCLV